jgi:hypothetical protein
MNTDYDRVFDVLASADGEAPFLWGVYSHEAARQNGSIIYETPSGENVVVTGVCSTRESLSRYNWPDAIEVGPVTNFVSTLCGPIGPNLNQPKELFYRSPENPRTAAGSMNSFFDFLNKTLTPEMKLNLNLVPVQG